MLFRQAVIHAQRLLVAERLRPHRVQTLAQIRGDVVDGDYNRKYHLNLPLPAYYINWENSVRAGTTTGSVREKQSAAMNGSENTA